jgi:ABC-2 type transport system ATP-binding protein
LSVCDLVKTMSRRRVLDGVNLQVARGEVYGLVGPNGAGKTTLLRCVVGFLRQDRGTVLVRGHDMVTEPATARAQMGALIDRPGFYPFLTGEENLRELILARGWRPEPALVRTALERVGLAEDGRRHVRTYSKGMGQRLALAAALLFRPPVVVLDEPTDGLDPRGIKDVRDLVRNLRSEGHAVLLCTHDLHQVESLSDRIGVLHHGHLLAEGAPRQIAGTVIDDDLAPGDERLERAVLDLLARADLAAAR